MFIQDPLSPSLRRHPIGRGAFVLMLALVVPTPVSAEEPRQSLNGSASLPSEPPPFLRHSMGSSLFMLANLFFDKEDSPVFYQLNYKFMLTPQDGLSIEAVTWKYHAPLGIPYGSSWEDPSHRYPGAVQAYGLGVAYQRLLWKGIYVAAHASAMRQIYLDESSHKIQTGFQLFMTFRLGYHLSFYEDRFFLEPSIAATLWPINTNLPASFAAQEERWPSYFLGEPGLHFGVNF